LYGVVLQDFSVVIGNEHHFLTRHRGYSYNTDLVGKSGLFEVRGILLSCAACRTPAHEAYV